MRSADRERVLAQRADIVAAATAALDAGGIGSPRAMSRRQRWQLLSFDARGDLAAVAVARRGKRSGLVVEAHRFRRREGGWAWDRMGPTLDFTEPTLPPRSTSVDHGWSESTGQGNVRTGDCVGLWRLAAQATRIRTGGTTEPVPPHGWIVMVAPTTGCCGEVLDAHDAVIGELRVGRSIEIPRRFRVAMWWNRRRHRDGAIWFNYAPRRSTR